MKISDSTTFCRICFTSTSVMQDLSNYLPIIRIIASTNISYDKNQSSKICKSCANGLILANLFRIKVIESNAKYRELLAVEGLKRERERSELNQSDQRDLEMEEEGPVSDDDMQVEFLNEFFNAVDEKNVEVVKVDKAPQKMPITISLRKVPLTNKKIKEVKENLKHKILGDVTQKPKPICFICTKPGSMLNLLSPFKETLNRIVSVGDVNNERVCDSCLQKLQLSKTFFTKLDSSMKRELSKDCCQFCTKNNELINTSQGSFSIFNSLPKSRYESRIHYNGKTCLTCVQLLNRIKMIRHGYLSKGKCFEMQPKIVVKKVDCQTSQKKQLISEIIAEGPKRRPREQPKQKLVESVEQSDESDAKKIVCKTLQRSSKLKISDLKERLKEQCRKEVPTPEIAGKSDKSLKGPETKVHVKKIDVRKCSDPKKALISRIMADMPESFEGPCNDESSEEFDETYEDISSPLPSKNSKKRIRIRTEPRYIRPDPNEPLPEDYQCHMSDFEEQDSDSEVPPVRFRTPLNVPFTPTYLRCPDCATKFINSYEMEAHIDCIHRTTTNTCNFCNKRFTAISMVKSHKLRVHCDFSTFDFKKQCDICGILSKRFDDHLTAVHLGTRPYSCQLCSYTGKTKHSLKCHISVIHLGEKRFKCKYCDKGFSYSADRGRHEIAMHTKQFKYICQFCGKCCLKKNFLTAHLRSQHADQFYEEC